MAGSLGSEGEVCPSCGHTDIGRVPTRNWRIVRCILCGWSGGDPDELSEARENVAKHGHAFPPDDIRVEPYDRTKPYRKLLMCWLDLFQDSRWNWREADWKTVGQLRRRLVERLEQGPDAWPDILFFRCDSGWIGFLIVVADQYAEVQASYVYDPFPGLVDWLEQVADGGFPASFTVDEESGYVRFELRRLHDSALLRVYETDTSTQEAPGRKLSIEAAVELRDVPAAFYRELRRFVRESFDPFEWAGTTIGEELSHAQPDFSRAGIWSMSRADLIEFIERHVPKDWITPDAVNRMEVPALRLRIREALDDSIYGWSGSDLRFLRSERLERLLERLASDRAPVRPP